MQTEIVLKYRGWLLWLTLAMIAFFVLGAGWGFLHAKNVTMSLATGLLFLTGLFLLIDFIFTNVFSKKKITLSESGIHDSLVYFKRSLPWHRVLSMGPYTQSHRRFLGIVDREKHRRARGLWAFLSELIGGNYSLRIPLDMITAEEAESIGTAYDRYVVSEEPGENQPVLPDNSSNLTASLLTMATAFVLLAVNQVLVTFLKFDLSLLNSLLLLFCGWYFYEHRSRDGMCLSNKASFVVILFLFSIVSVFANLAIYNYLQRGIKLTGTSLIGILNLTYGAHLGFEKDQLYRIFSTLGVPAFVFVLFRQPPKKAET